MLNLKFTFSLIKKEFFQIIRDPSSILIAVVLPALLMLIYGYGLSLDTNSVKIALIDQDHSRLSYELSKTIENSKYIEPVYGESVEQFKDLITKSKIRGIVIIPNDFSKSYKSSNKAADVQIITDGSEPNTAKFVSNYIQASIRIFQSQLKPTSTSKKRISVKSRFWYNPELESKNFLVPGSLAIIMTLVGTLLTALVIAREYERGTLEALLVTPISKLEFVVAKIIPYYLLGLFSMVLCMFFAIFIYHVPFRSSILVLWLVTSLFLFAALSQGLLISQVTRSQYLASQMALTTAFLPSFMLSGFIFEINSMPKIIQGLTYLFPARYFVSMLKTMFIVGDVSSLILKNSFFLLLIGVFFFSLLVMKSSKSLD
jgi:ABC-2 type transport system permease protein